MLNSSLEEPNAKDALDTEILDLVKGAGTSVRLRNAIDLAAKLGKLPFITVKEYANSGASAPLLACRHIDNLGRKTATELHDLVSTYLISLRSGELAASVVDISKVLDLFYSNIGDVSTADAICDMELPVRLKHALESSGYLADALVKNLKFYDERLYELARQPNVGRKSLIVWRRAIEMALDNQLARLGLNRSYSAALKQYIVENGECGAQAARVLQMAPIPKELASSIDDRIDAGVQPTIPALEVLVEEALSTLGTRERDVVSRRFGIGVEKQTLEDIGSIYGVTRERIRQLEAKGLRQLRFRYGKRIRTSLLHNFESTWAILASGDAIAMRELDQRRRLTPPHVIFGLELTDLSVQDCLSHHGVKCTGGWISKAFPAKALAEAAKDFNGGIKLFRLPCPWPLLMPSASDNIAAVQIRFSKYSEFLGYVLNEKPRPRIRRALRAHSILASIGEPVDVLKLLDLYRNRFSDDQCSSRDLDIVISSNPHLFVSIYDGTWSSLGAPPPQIGVDIQEECRVDSADDEQADLDTLNERLGISEPLTNSRALEAALQKCGPLRLSELIERGSEFLPAGRSVTSIGPTLITNKDLFERPLPGLYALPGQVPAKALIMQYPPNYLLSEEQVRTYALARWSGEPWGAFPLWCAELEVAWCRWAQEKCPAETLNALLAIVEIDSWPVEADEKEKWRAQSANRAHFTLHYSAREESFVLPELISVLAACFVIKSRGALGWIGANRIMQRRLTDHTSVGLLGLLIALDVLVGPKHWQMRHGVGPGLDGWLAKLTSALQRDGQLVWDSAIGASLRDQLVGGGVRFPMGSWLNADQLDHILNSDVVAESPVESLLSAIKVQEDESSFEALLASVLAGSASSNMAG